MQIQGFSVNLYSSQIILEREFTAIFTSDTVSSVSNFELVARWAWQYHTWYNFREKSVVLSNLLWVLALRFFVL